MARAWLIVLALAGCADDPGPSRRRGQAPIALACTCDEAEDCDACFRRVGACCYEDELIGGQAAALAARCEENGACRACCAECADLACPELIRREMCPPIAPE